MENGVNTGSNRIQWLLEFYFTFNHTLIRLGFEGVSGYFDILLNS